MIAHGGQGGALRYALCAVSLCLGVGSAQADAQRPVSAPSAGAVLHASGLDIGLPTTRGAGDGPHTYELDLNAVTPAAQTRLGGRSGRLRLSIDCKRSLFRAERLLVFRGPDRSGGEEDVRLPDEWVKGVRGTYLPALGAKLCASSDDAPASSGETKSASSPSGAANATVQLGSFTSSAAAEAAWIALTRRDKTAGRRTHQVETARVGQSRVYRLLVATRSSEEADELCRGTLAMKQPCMVRQSPKRSNGR